MSNYTMPDFDGWATNVEIALDKWSLVGKSPVAVALEQAFSQGRSLGTREGYNEGLNNGWWHELEKEQSKAGE